MNTDRFIGVDEIAADLGMSRNYAYRIIREMNETLKEQGYMTVPGRVSRKYYEERLYAPMHSKEIANDNL